MADMPKMQEHFSAVPARHDMLESKEAISGGCLDRTTP